MSIQSLPENANLEHLKKQAKSLLKSIKNKDGSTLSRIKPYFSNPESIGLQGAQLIVARDYGFSSWSKLVQHLDSDNSTTNQSLDQIANEFLRHVILIYSETESADPARFDYAAKILQDHPDILDESIYVASAAGDITRVKQWLKEDISLVNRLGGYHHWEPLMYAAYSRLPGASTFDVARELIACGANPNAHYMWGGQYRFTALTGVFGQGEGGPVKLPEHPQCESFARLLLSAGANPNDSQVAYNRMFEKDNTYLALLLEYGLSEHDKNNWLLKVDDQLVQHPETTLRYQLNHAITSGKLDRVKLLVEHGVNLDYEENDRSPYQLALLEGHPETAEYLKQQGASHAPLASIDLLKVALLAANRKQVDQLVSEDSELLQQAISTYPALTEKAVDLKKPDTIKLLVELGFDVNHVSGRTALHQAAWLGDLELIKLLIDLGADPSMRDHIVFAPPLGWAAHNGKEDAVRFLETQKTDVFAAAARGLITGLEFLLEQNPDLVDTVFGDARPNKEKPCENDWMTPLAFAVLNQQLKAVRFLLERNASANISNGQGLTLASIAEGQGNSEIVQLLSTSKA